MEERTMQKKNAGIARNFALKGLLLLAALTLSTGFFACKVAVGGGEGGKIESYTITYVNVEGATNENPASYNVDTGTITLKDPVKTGYTFAGWYMAEDFTGNAVTEIVQGTTGNITLYAKWLENYTITYELNGGINAPENPAGYNVETGTITLKDPAKPGYTFAGWYSADNSPVTKIPQGSTGDITLYAKWVTDIEGKVFVRGGDATLNGK